jgi:transposase
MIGSVWRSRDEEKRKIKVHLSSLKKAHEQVLQTCDQLRNHNKELKQKNKELEAKIAYLEKENEELQRQRDEYKNMIFKSNKKSSPSRQEEAATNAEPATPKKKCGAQQGHKAKVRKLPEEIDCQNRAYLTHCPDCHGELQRANDSDKHVVEDIPDLEQKRAVVIEHQIERQWCPQCKKEVSAVPAGVIPNARFGINVLMLIMILKYSLRASMDSIIFFLLSTYGITISKGAIYNLLNKARKCLGPAYEKIAQDIKFSAVKQADETGWRIAGINSWIWAFLSNDAVYYTAEESRGKGIPDNFFRGSPEGSILIRDDYPVYKNLNMKQQSCWAHLLRKSYEEVQRPSVSNEMKLLHEKIKHIYSILTETIKMPFSKTHRKQIYKQVYKDILAIIKTCYSCEYARQIQTRIANQKQNLLTALLYKNVPLTNNLAERSIRPMVVIRKISGGSKQPQGAKVLQINMSILQTIRMKKLPLISTLKQYLLESFTGKQ